MSRISRIAIETGAGPAPGAELAGTSVGSSSVVGALIVSALLAGSITGTSTATGDLTDFPAGSDLAGITAGTSTATGDLTAFPVQPGEALDGILTGTSTATGDLTAAPAGLAGALQGTSTATGDLTTFEVVTLEGLAAGTSTATGALATSVTLAGLAQGHSWLFGTLASNQPPRIPIVIDLAEFFNTNELAHDAVMNGTVPFKTIVTDWYDPIIGGTANMGGTDPQLIAQHDQIPDVKDGDTVDIAGYVYVVREVQPDNTGIVRLKCEL